jgi:hypothetical protein
VAQRVVDQVEHFRKQRFVPTTLAGSSSSPDRCFKIAAAITGRRPARPTREIDTRVAPGRTGLLGASSAKPIRHVAGAQDRITS